MGVRCFWYLVLSILLLAVFGLGVLLGDRAFWMMVYPLGLGTYPLSFIQITLLFVMRRSFNGYEAICGKEFLKPSDEQFAEYKKA